jgi:ATP synthase protein I
MRFSGFGFQMVATLCLAAWGGLKLDEYFGLDVPIFLIVLLLLALGGSMYLFIRQVSKNN